jgi:glycosyltransferase involved in cell wall biosynthesis
MKAPKKIGMVTLGANVPSTRFRFMPYQAPLIDRGHRCRLWTSFPSVYDSIRALGWRLSTQWKRGMRWAQYLDAKWYRPDTIYLERGCFHDDSLWMDERFRKATPRLVLDVDDAIFLQFPQKVQRLIAMSDHVVVSNPSLYQYAAQYHPRITEIPTCVPLSKFLLRRYPDDPPDRPIVGWIGTASNVGFLAECSGALRRVANELPFTLLVVSNNEEPLRKLDLMGVDVRFETWSAVTEVSFLHEMDIGLMPLPTDQEWMKYKAATKLVQYMAIGIPAIATPVGVNKDILEKNQVGFSATTESEWVDALRSLLRNFDLRCRMGQAGRTLVESRFCVEANIEKLENTLLGHESVGSG